MTHKEFVFWLKGLLDGKNYLTEEGIDFIKSKMKDIADPPEGCDNYPMTPGELYPASPYIIDYTIVCPMGGYHEYPDVWHGIFPPPCKKCGYSNPQPFVTYCNNSQTALAPQPKMSAEDYAFSSSGEVIEKLEDIIRKVWYNCLENIKIDKRPDILKPDLS